MGMGLVGLLGTAAKRAKDLGDAELLQLVIDSFNAAAALEEENRNLKALVAQLEGNLRDRFVFRNGAYWLRDGSDPETPRCPRCWDVDHREAVLVVYDGEFYKCLSCDRGWPSPLGRKPIPDESFDPPY